jgi:hypothetical protein
MMVMSMDVRHRVQLNCLFGYINRIINSWRFLAYTGSSKMMCLIRKEMAFISLTSDFNVIPLFSATKQTK